MAGTPLWMLPKAILRALKPITAHFSPAIDFLFSFLYFYHYNKLGTLALTPYFYDD